MCMRFFHFSAIFCSLLVSLATTVSMQASAAPSEILSSYRVPLDSERMPAIAERFEVLRRTDDGFEVVVPVSRREELLKLEPECRILKQDIDADLHNKDALVDYYDYSSMETHIKGVAQRYPAIARLSTYGTSPEGHPEYFLTVGKTLSANANRPELMITGATHGDEMVTVEVVLGLIDQLVEGYGKDARITAMVDNHVIHFIPAVNVDGFVHQTRYAEGRDPNRDYPYPDEPNRSPVTAVRDIMKFFNAHKIVGTIDYHAAASMIMFPWAYTYSHIPQPDYKVADDLTSRMAETNGFAHGPIAETIYVAPGSSADYYYWKNHSISLGIEVSHDFAPTKSEVSDIVRENTESTWIFIEHF